MIRFVTSAFPILLPIACLIGTEVVFLRSLKRREGKIDFLEIGVFYSAIVSTYAVFPWLEYLAGGLDFSIISDNRLYLSNPSPKELAPIFWYYAIYLFCFWFGYRASRGGKWPEHCEISKPNSKLLWALLSVYLSIYLFTLFLNVRFGIQAADSYADSYLLYSNLPPFWRQLANHVWGITLFSQMLLAAFLAAHYVKYKRYIWGWLAVEVASIAMFGVGSRTGLFTLLLTIVVTYHFFVKNLSWRIVGSFCVGTLVLFLALGVVRAISASSDSDPNSDQFSLLTSSNEFDALFANAYDLRQLKALGQTREMFPWVYFSDIVNLIPDQLFPVHKLDPSNWYVQSFYPDYAERGGGFAFGAIAESIVGLGWIDLLWRGALVGWAFGFVRRYLITGEMTFWKYILYLWMTIFCYQVFRGTTFVLLSRSIYLFVLPAGILWLLRDARAKRRVGTPVLNRISS